MPRKIDYFCSDTIRQDLKGKTVRGGVYTGLSQAARIGVQLLAIPLLARLLQPEDFGLLAMVTVFTGFASMFVDAGLSMATVQQAEVTRKQASNLFWIASALGVVIAAVVACCSPLIAWFYSEPRLIAVTLALCSSFVLSGLTIQHQALLRRTMQFDKLAFVDVGSQVAGQAVGIAWAWRSFDRPNDYWALVLIPIVTALTKMLAAWSACGWVPSAPDADSSVRPMLRYGLNLSGGQIINYLARNGDNMLIGWYWGGAALGFYERAYKLLLFPLQSLLNPMSSVAVPALSRLRHDPEGYRRYFRRGVQFSSLVMLPVVVASVIMAEPLVLTVLGPGWGGSAPIFLALSPAALMATTAPASHWIYLSWGHTDQLFRIVIINTVLMLVGFAIALQFGPIWVAASFSATTCLIRIPNVLFALKPTPLGIGDLIGPMKIPAIGSLTAAVSVLVLLGEVRGTMAPQVELAVGAFVFGVTYLLVLTCFKDGRRLLVMSDFRSLFSTRQCNQSQQ